MFKVKKGKAVLLVAAATALVAALAYDKKNKENLEEEDNSEKFAENVIEVDNE